MEQVGLAAQRAEQEPPLQALLPEGRAARVGTRAGFKVSCVMERDDQACAAGRHIRLSGTEYDLRLGPEPFRRGPVQREPPGLLPRGVRRKGLVGKAAPGLPGQRHHTRMVCGIGQNAQVDIATVRKMLGKLPGHAARPGRSVDVPQVHVGQHAHGFSSSLCR